MEHRRGLDHQQNDMLKVLIDLQDSTREDKDMSQMDIEEEDSQFEADAKLPGLTKAAVIDEETVTQSAVLFLVAGLDTISHTLSIISYHLAMNQEVQDRVREEVDGIAASLDKSKITYDDIKK